MMCNEVPMLLESRLVSNTKPTFIWPTRQCAILNATFRHRFPFISINESLFACRLLLERESEIRIASAKKKDARKVVGQEKVVNLTLFHIRGVFYFKNF